MLESVPPVQTPPLKLPDNTEDLLLQPRRLMTFVGSKVHDTLFSDFRRST